MDQNLFQRLGSWVMGGLRRERGTQYSAPNSYSEASASPVNFDSALQLSAVWACVKLLAETVSSLPLNIYKVSDSGRKPASTHPLSILFSGRVNRYQTRVEFFESVLLNLIMHGNAYISIQRAGDRIIGLLPLMSAQIETRLLDDGAVVHQYTHEAGVTVFAAESIWHLKLMGNGIVGLSPLAHQRNTLGIAQAAEGAVGKIYRNGAKPSGVLSIDRILTPQQRQQVRESFANLTMSSDDRLMVLEGGMKFDAVSMTPEDIELLASRQFQIAEICRWYGVPSVMVNDSAGTTVWGSGIEQIVAGFYKLTLRPLIEKIEASMLVNLMSDAERSRYEVEFDFDSLLRSDAKTRFEYHRVAVSAGLMTPNEVRRLEGLPDLAGGDKLMIQGAMVPIEQAGVAFGNAATAPSQTTEEATAKRLSDLTAEVKSLKSQPAPQPIQIRSGDITIRLPEIKAGDVHLPAPVVNVAPAQIKFDAHVAAPEVKVEAPVVHVAPPQVDVVVEADMPAPVVSVNLPARKTESTLERDTFGRIVKSTQIETDL